MTLSWIDPPACLAFEIAPIAGLEPDLLAPEAESLGPRAGERRRRDYAAGRGLARRLLEASGYGGHALVQTADGAPRWPDGVIGSISHCRDLAFVAMAAIGELDAVGIDIETLARFHDGLADHILTDAERARLPKDNSARRRRMAISFSAKEAFYKQQFALFGENLSFQDAELHVSDEGQTLSIGMTDRQKHGHLAADVSGCYALDDTHVATMVWRRRVPEHSGR